MSDLFEEKSLHPMLIGESRDPFDDPDYIFELKWDGERCLAYLDPKTETALRNKRNEKILLKFPELRGIHRQVKKRCILDGELMVLVDGKPNFFELQRRALMSHSFRMELAAKRYPANFVAFDCLYYEGRSLLDLPLMERKTYLEKVVRESDTLAVSRYLSGQGTVFFDLAKKEELEGIVAKRRDSFYTPGKRTKDWIKIKNLQDDDFVVCGYLFKENHIISLILGQYENKIFTYQGHVTLGVGGRPFDRIQNQPKTEGPPFPVPPGNEEAIWIKPELVCTVAYMQRTSKGGIRHPVFKGLREDKTAKECTAPVWETKGGYPEGPK